MRDFSEKVKISKSTLSRYENDNVLLTEEKENEIKKALGQSLERAYELHVHFDYLRMTFFESSIRTVLEKVLCIPEKYFIREHSKKNNYEAKYSCGNIVVFDRVSDDSQGILLDLTGQGVYEFEQHLESMGMSFRDWLKKVLDPSWYSFRGYYSRLHSTRLDIAIDEMYDPINGNFDLYELKKRRDQDLISSNFRVYREQEKKFQQENAGLTLYHGARGGNLFVRFYEKRYELADKLGLSVDDVLEEYGVWNRYELEIGKEINEKIFADYINGVSLDDIAINLLLSKFEVFDERMNEHGNLERVFYDKWYEIFGSWKKVKINHKREEPSIEKNMRWIERQGAGVLKGIQVYLGKEEFNKWLNDVIDRAELSEKREKQLMFEKMIEQKGLNLV
ncbi:replication initiation factor domain-containing protein [Enterococcus sp. BWM-S5]|uniref:Replication initiation factor domain-containing protein n=1 Tax=Enterococcus larvae TaxID=2794352 RepID=A0ABS4CM54_9ENTE|nr:replication initiation factor domain-containing protein [Enterococcus larvae]